jgi:hypothetical protein
VRRRKRPPNGGLLFRGSGKYDHFTTLDLWAGLCGVCKALDQLAGESDPDIIHRLSMASNVLASILDDRVEV